ncbi:rab GDP-dissociation inhibitor [Gaeumannomyces tritici R3-111a-1]|uniref:Rab GDP dissociation inhibitor n=1 Tax=Gaeumannomyces tritici (strain R3-111a-1) TaxID=644352 RepID=J3NNN5_GAET3|nr:rab GDP-dissociation inhibitor [Gaeumannomyces tritici R3-111a-1]EJT77787.1 rab GDP-dissociation inhibitor [Gaeumannomyces tritici R3-111a-1]
MNEVDKEYDVLVLGTGLTECILSGVLSAQGKKVLHLDRNPYYGGEAASVNLKTLYQKYPVANAGPEPWTKFGPLHAWNIDLIPKFLMATGELIKAIVQTKVYPDYVKFTLVAGSYVQQGKSNIAKVPSSAGEAAMSSLLGFNQKRYTKSFLEWLVAFKADDPKTYKGFQFDTDPKANQVTMAQVYEKFGLDANTREFVGHGMALYSADDEYIDDPSKTLETIERIRLYGFSVKEYKSSPYLYPEFGLGELPQSFARLSAVYGGTYMLNTNVDEILYEDGKAVGIKATMSGFEPEMKFETRAKLILGDPTYFPDRVKFTKKVLRAICVLDHPINGTNNSDSCQIIIPQSQIGRKHDIYIACISYVQRVCPKGYYVAIVSTIAEMEANPQEELKPGLERLGKIEEMFMGPAIPLYEPLEDGKKDGIFISKSYDASSHFESTTDDVRDIYKRAMGEDLVLNGLRGPLEIAQ